MTAGELLKRWVRTPAEFLGMRRAFTTSEEYWEQRYRNGHHSGAGSYNRLAEFKANILNKFVVENQIRSVIEFGSGDGAQLRLADYPSYLGIDVSDTVIKAAAREFAGNPGVQFMHASLVRENHTADLALSLDVIYHLVEDDVFERYMRQLFRAADRYVIIYSSNEDKLWSERHVRHRKFTTWVESNIRDFALVQQIPNRYPYDGRDVDNTSFADFFVYLRTVPR